MMISSQKIEFISAFLFLDPSGKKLKHQRKLFSFPDYSGKRRNRSVVISTAAIGGKTDQPQPCEQHGIGPGFRHCGNGVVKSDVIDNNFQKIVSAVRNARIGASSGRIEEKFDQINITETGTQGDEINSGARNRTGQGGVCNNQ